MLLFDHPKRRQYLILKQKMHYFLPFLFITCIKIDFSLLVYIL